MAKEGSTGTSRRGFASMDAEKRRAIASKGGKASGGNFANDRSRAAEAGRKGGTRSPSQREETTTREPAEV